MQVLPSCLRPRHSHGWAFVYSDTSKWCDNTTVLHGISSERDLVECLRKLCQSQVIPMANFAECGINTRHQGWLRFAVACNFNFRKCSHKAESTGAFLNQRWWVWGTQLWLQQLPASGIRPWIRVHWTGLEVAPTVYKNIEVAVPFSVEALLAQC